MANLVKLPVEIQLEIYQNLTSIDDALHLARACKRLNDVFESSSNRLNILRCIIQNAPHHKDDLQLHETEACFSAFASNFDDLRRPGVEKRPFYPGLPIVSTETTNLSAEIVWSIVCRWHGMKVLFNLYCDSTIRAEFLRSMIPYVPDGSPPTDQWKMDVAYETPLPPPSCHNTEYLRASEKQPAYERFYRALCSHWLMLNKVWAVRISQYWTSEEERAVFAQLRRIWIDDPTRESLQEKFEAIEVIDYVWDFLARKTYPDPDQFCGWLRGDMAEDVEGPQIPWAANWLWFFHTTKYFLRPPHIIELLNHVWNPGSRALEQPTYVHNLGSFYVSRGEHHEGAQDRGNAVFMAQEMPDFLFLFNWIELTGIYRLVGAEDGEQWKRYRHGKWVDELRGRVLFAPEPDDQLLKRIKDWGSGDTDMNIDSLDDLDDLEVMF